jgi:pSer/pThr/pTyr-binding forkhead associated (FHA) protein
MLSRVHCSIEYSENNQWVIRDGYISKYKDIPNRKMSTNGTWLLFNLIFRFYLGEETEIQDSMVFKANLTLFKVFTL